MTLEERSLAIGGLVDIEALQERILTELCGLCGAQTAALWVAGEHAGLRLRAWRGQVDRAGLPELIEPSLVQETTWRAGTTLLVPLVTQTGALAGLVQLGDGAQAEFAEHLLGETGWLGRFAAQALEVATHVAQLQRQGLRDATTGAYTGAYFADCAQRELSKARRYGRSFSLLTFSLDHLAQLRLRLGHAAARQALEIVSRVIAGSVRESDVVASSTDHELQVLLPETDAFGAVLFVRRALAAVREDPAARALEARVPMGLTGGAATFPRDGGELAELSAHCRRRMDELRGSLARQLHVDELGFWDEVDLLLGTPASPRLPLASGEPSKRGRVSEALFDELQHELVRELLREPAARALVYVATAAIHAELPVLRALEAAPRDFAPRVYVLGRRADVGRHPVATPIFLEGEERLAQHQLLLWLGDGAAYGLLQRAGKGAGWGFHTSDPSLVEGLVSKLQGEYDLKPY